MSRSAKKQRKKISYRLRSFVQSRLHELLGAGLILTGLGMIALMLLYSPDDFAFSTKQTGPDQRSLYDVFGGAMDVGIQGFGMAMLFPIFLALAWGWRFLSHQTIPFLLGRLVLAPLCLVGLSIGLYLIPLTMPWPILAGWGGAFGTVAFGKLYAFSGQFLTFMSPYILPISFAVGSVFVGLFVIGLTGQEWRWVGQFIAQNLLKLWQVLVWLGQKIWGFLVKYLPERDTRKESQRTKILPFGLAQRQEPMMGEAAPVASKNIRVTMPASFEATARVIEDEDDEEPFFGTLPARLETVSSSSPALRLREKLTQDQTLKLVPNTDFRLPPLDLLTKPEKNKKEKPIDAALLQDNARQLEAVLNDFGVNGHIVNVRPGPVVTLYELEPAPGVKTSRVINLSDDVARSMRAISVRSAVVPGQNVIGMELPNQRREKVVLHEILNTPAYEQTASTLALALGKDIGGAPVVVDLARMPHLLMAGTTGSGKSVAINVLILSLLYRLTPDQCRFIMIDPKMLELSVYDGIPHLLSPVVTDPKKAIVALKWVVREMERRYQAMARLGVRNIAGYNQKIVEAAEKGEVLSRKVQTGYDHDTGEAMYEDVVIDTNPLPYIVVIADEIADLMMVAGKEIEAAIQRLAQMARASGIHLILATQRPSVDVITGTIKANFPCRISFQVTSKIDSRTILGEQGAEQLLGMGDMLYMAPGGRITRVHGPFVSDDEVEKAVTFLKKQGSPVYVDEVTEDDEEGGGPDLFGFGSGGDNDLYDRAVALVAREGKASTSFIQRHLQIGYNRAATLIERMEKEGVVSKANHVGKREVLVGAR